MLKPFAIAVLAAAVSLAGPAHAEEGYWSYVVDGGGEDTIYAAWVSNARGFELGVDCTESLGDRSIYVITDEIWEETTSYADDVPTTFTINGTDHLNTFLFEHTSNNELTVAQYELDHLDEVSALIEALRGASGDITVSYFTTTVLFSADSVADALAQMDNDCLPF